MTHHGEEENDRSGLAAPPEKVAAAQERALQHVHRKAVAPGKVVQVERIQPGDAGRNAHVFEADCTEDDPENVGECGREHEIADRSRRCPACLTRVGNRKLLRAASLFAFAGRSSFAWVRHGSSGRKLFWETHYPREFPGAVHLSMENSQHFTSARFHLAVGRVLVGEVAPFKSPVPCDPRPAFLFCSKESSRRLC